MYERLCHGFLVDDDDDGVEMRSGYIEATGIVDIMMSHRRFCSNTCWFFGVEQIRGTAYNLPSRGKMKLEERLRKGGGYWWTR